MTATEILKKHGKKPTKTKRENAKIQTVMKAHAGICANEKKVRDKKVAEDAAVNKAAADHEIKAPAEGSRADLMNQAKAKGIKYYRIMTKEELASVLDYKEQGNEASIAEIQEEAKSRWKAGWGTKKGAPRA